MLCDTGGITDTLSRLSERLNLSIGHDDTDRCRAAGEAAAG